MDTGTYEIARAARAYTGAACSRRDVAHALSDALLRIDDIEAALAPLAPRDEADEAAKAGQAEAKADKADKADRRHRGAGPVRAERGSRAWRSSEHIVAGGYNVVAKLGRVALRVSIAPATETSTWASREEMEHARHASAYGFGLRVLWHGVVGDRHVSCWPWATCAATERARPRFEADIVAVLRAASRHFVMLDVKLANVVFLRDTALLIDFDPLFVREATCPSLVTDRFVAVQMLLIDLSAAAARVPRVCSPSAVRRAAGLDDTATTRELGSALARAARGVMGAFDEGFAVMLARVLAKYTADAAQATEPSFVADAELARTDHAYLAWLMREALLVCDDKDGAAADGADGPDYRHGFDYRHDRRSDGLS